MSTWAKLAIISLFAILVRWCTSLNGYSGAGKPPMFGDYEAQRHWQEITVNLPMKEWYANTTDNDLNYWGLDYPPLTAYHSYLCGMVARFINPDWVALNSSRGYESYEHKLFMRYSVLITDLLIYFPAVYWIFAARKSHPWDPDSALKGYMLMLLYPGLTLIDYGHFQYNSVSLGLALAAVTSLATDRDVLGSSLFVLALNYKQMELYHAMPFFCFLLGTCLLMSPSRGISSLFKIGLSVILTFGLCWLPFLTTGDLEIAKQVLSRLFPFARGIFEDKVSNVWCSLSVLIKWKQVMSRDQILLMCLGATILGLVPSSLDLLVRPSIKKFRYALVNSAMVFFLFSFQVHEKSILIPALIVCTLIPDHPFWCLWFLQVSTFSMLPLLIKDGQLIAFLAQMVLYPVLFYSFYPVEKPKPHHHGTDWAGILSALGFCISCVGQVVLTLATVIVPPPERLPDLFPLVISVFSCAHFLLFTLYFHYCQFTTNPMSHHPGVQYQPESYSGKSAKKSKSGAKKSNDKAMNIAKLEKTTKTKGKLNKLKLGKKKHD